MKDIVALPLLLASSMKIEDFFATWRPLAVRGLGFKILGFRVVGFRVEGLEFPKIGGYLILGVLIIRIVVLLQTLLPVLGFRVCGTPIHSF